MRRALALAAMALALLALPACGEKEEPGGPGRTEPFELLLDYFPNADHAGIYAAQRKGRFRDVGLDVEIRTPTDPAEPIPQVAAGRVDLAVSYTPEVLRARDQGRDVVAVAALVREPLTSIISLPHAGIRRPADLRGKRVGTAGIDYQSAYLQSILEQARVPRASVTERNVGFDLVPALLTRKVDAVLGAFWNYEGLQLARQRRRPQILRVEDAGVPPYDELVLVANAAALERDPHRIRRFVGALARGTQDLRRDPEAAIDALTRANRDLDPKLQRAVVRVTLPLFLPPRGRPFGHQDAREWRRFAAWMYDHELLRRRADVRAAMTNRALPGRAP